MHYIQLTCKIKEFLTEETEGLPQKDLYILAQQRKEEIQQQISELLGYEVSITQSTLYKHEGEDK